MLCWQTPVEPGSSLEATLRGATQSHGEWAERMVNACQNMASEVLFQLALSSLSREARKLGHAQRGDGGGAACMTSPPNGKEASHVQAAHVL